MTDVKEAQRAVDEAQAKLSAFDAEIAAADELVSEAQQTYATLNNQLELGNVVGLADHISKTEAALAVVESRTAIVDKMRPRRVVHEHALNVASERLTYARKEAAKPEAKRLEKRARDAWMRAAEAHAEYLRFLKAYNFPYTGVVAGMGSDASLKAIFAVNGLAVRIDTSAGSFPRVSLTGDVEGRSVQSWRAQLDKAS